VQALPQSPFVPRNREPILAVLRRVLVDAPHGNAPANVLELASGTGEHAVYFAAAMPELIWQPTDRDAAMLPVIVGHRAASSLVNLLPPLLLDASSPSWPVARADAIVAINMVHISPWAATQGLMAAAERLLPPGGAVCLYGAYREEDHHTAPSNEAFDADLRRRNPSWGLRDRDAVIVLAQHHGLDFTERVAMPANNLMLIFHAKG
jgi:hypothetical protein